MSEPLCETDYLAERVIIIVGMHRSGTSALAGSLEETTGLYLGHVVRTCPDNPKGWCENPLIFMTNDSILRENGGSVVAPPDICRWSSQHQLMRDTIIDSFRGHSFWGFKDPRTLFTLEGWRQVLPHAELIGIFRHPRLVCESLERRDRRMVGQSASMWLKYNRRLLAWKRRLGFPLLSFDDLEISFEQQIQALIQFMNLPQKSLAPKFFETRYRHTDIRRSSAFSGEILDTYAELVAAHRATWRDVPVAAASFA